MVAAIFQGLPDIFTKALGEDVIYTPVGGETMTIRAIPVLTPVETLQSSTAPTDDVQKVVHVREVDAGQSPEGASIVLDGVDYLVVTPIQPDGKGMIMLTLARKA